MNKREKHLVEKCKDYLSLSESGQTLNALNVDSTNLYHDTTRIFNNELEAICKDLRKLGYDMEILFGITKYDSNSSLTAVTPNATVIMDPYELMSKRNTFYILIEQLYIDELENVFNRLLSVDEASHFFGKATQKEDAVTEKMNMAEHFARIALGFSFYHELSHIIYGHLDSLYQHNETYKLHAAGAQITENVQLAKKRKLFELDADLNALLHVSAYIKNPKVSFAQYLNFPIGLQTLFAEVGFVLTILFRLIESWRRTVSPIYKEHLDHPHPDVRDGYLMSYVEINMDTMFEEGFKDVLSGYKIGRELAINTISDAGKPIPNFRVPNGKEGQYSAYQELNWMADQLTVLRKTGTGERDLRVVYRNLKK